MTANAWLVRPAPRGDARLRLVCFPHAGGGAAGYAAWSRRLPDEIEVVAVRLPGRETRLGEQAYRRLEPLLDDLAEAIVPELDAPFAFFGHSLGALIAFELARRLRRGGGPLPEHLFASGRRAPQLPEREPPVSHLPDDAFTAEVVRRYDGIPAPVLADPALLRFFLPLLRADCELLEGYDYAPAEPLPVPISAFGGREDTRVPVDELAAWSRQTTGAFRVATFAGGHFFLREAETEVLHAVGSALLPAGEALTGAR